MRESWSELLEAVYGPWGALDAALKKAVGLVDRVKPRDQREREVLDMLLRVADYVSGAASRERVTDPMAVQLRHFMSALEQVIDEVKYVERKNPGIKSMDWWSRAGILLDKALRDANRSKWLTAARYATTAVNDLILAVNRGIRNQILDEAQFDDLAKWLPTAYESFQSLLDELMAAKGSRDVRIE